MSKKQKRQATATSAPARASSESTRVRASSSDFNPDYSYVIKDLKRIGTLAGSFFVILVVLAFFLR